jgi:hypothetical protein
MLNFELSQWISVPRDFSARAFVQFKIHNSQFNTPPSGGQHFLREGFDLEGDEVVDALAHAGKLHG